MNAGSDGGQEVARFSVEPAAHLADAFFDDSLDGSTPSGVKGAHGPIFPVNEDDRQAIGSLHGEQKAGSIGDQAIAGDWRVGGAIHAMNQIRMDLTQGDQRPRFLSAFEGQSLQKGCAIFLDGGAGIVFRKSQAQIVAAINFRETAGARAESMH
jgi:hypothetical protein